MSHAGSVYAPRGERAPDRLRRGPHGRRHGDEVGVLCVVDVLYAVPGRQEGVKSLYEGRVAAKQRRNPLDDAWGVNPAPGS